MILPTTNISIMMVRNALRYPSTSLGALCGAGSPYVNMWSKYKPVRNAFVSNRPADWWKATYKMCGLDVTGYNTPKAAGLGNWSYEPPRGGATEPYRLGDFAGYYTEARPFLYITPTPTINFDINRVTEHTFVFYPQNITNANNLSINDFDFLKNYYFAIYIEGAQYNTVVTATDTLGSQTSASQEVTMDLTQLYPRVGSYNIYYFISPVRLNQGDFYGGNLFYPIYKREGDAQFTVINIRESVVLPFFVYADQISSNLGSPSAATFKNLSLYSTLDSPASTTRFNMTYRVMYKCTFTNTTASQVTFYNTEIRLAFEQPDRLVYVTNVQSQTDPYFYLMNTSNQIITQGTIPANGSATFYIIADNLNYDNEGNFPPLNTDFNSMLEIEVQSRNTTPGWYVTDYDNLRMTFGNGIN